MTESISPRRERTPEIRYQPSLLSIPSAAGTVAPEARASIGAQPAPKPVARRKLWFFVAVGALSAVAAGALRETAEVSPHLHHGSPGYRQAKSGKNQLWHRRALTVYIDDSVARLDPAASDAVTRAFGHWVESQNGLPTLTFDTGKTSSTPKQDGKSTISYGRITVPGHERDLAITMTYSNDQTGEIIEADIMLNSAYPLAVLRAREDGLQHGTNGVANGSSKSSLAAESEDCRDRYDVQNVATHEVGHFFGLGEDMTERGSTMFPSIDECETHKRVLSSTDTDAIGRLYAELEAPEEPAADARGCSFVIAPAASGGPLWASLLVLGSLALRRRRGSEPA